MSLIRSSKRDSLRGYEKVSDKILYPTVNSLALKRTRLPLQLHDGGTDIETQEEMKKDSGPHRESKRTGLMAKDKGNPFRKYRAKIEMMVERRNEIFESAESAEITTSILTDSEKDEDLLYSSTEEYKKERMADWLLEEKKNENVKTNIRNESNDDSSVLSGRRCSYSSEDYEKVDVKSQCYPEAFVERDFDVNESFHRKKITGISKSTCDRESILFSSDEEKSSLRNNKKKKKKKKKKKRQFARYVLHYVPGYPGKRHKQPTKKKKKHYRFVTSFDSRARSLGEEDETSIEENQEFSRPKSLSRFELKYVMISAPSNFVHIASATNTRLMSNEKIASSKLEQSIITHEEKSANLPLLLRGKEVDKSINRLIGEETPMKNLRHVNEGRTPYVEIKRTSLGNAEERKGEIVDPCRSVKIETDDREMRISYEPILRTNVSFLWSDRTRNFLDNKNEQTRLSSSLVEKNEETFAGTFEEPYDDVGPPLSKSFSQEDDYDDVGPPPTCSDENTLGDGKYAKDDTYDDVLVPFLNKIEEKVETILDDERQESSINNDYYSLEDGEDERYIYDDVAVPVGEERVNSLYGDSMAASFMGSVLTNGKESEWEDVDDFTNALPCYCQHDCTCEKNRERCNTWSKKKTGQRSGKKWKRRRSRRCRKTSASSARTRHDSIVDVAITGSALLLADHSGKKEGEWRSSGNSELDGESVGTKTQGLVQMRLVDLDEDTDMQEASCYVHEESASEDSTYESLRFCQPDDFGMDSESETSGRVNGPNLNAENRGENTTNGNVYLEAPAKPIPPPPRESSLTETLGRRIKMLRRTWSITKGSLGRIRRRTLFFEEEQAAEEGKDLANVHHQQQLPDNGKYFSFRKHFRKNLTSFSTFYLNDSDGICTSRNNNNNNGTSKEAIYGNTNWYAAWSGTTKINNDCESSSRDVDHYSVLADQEPLYQFYEAAVARVAFESDSDGYEEVEDLNFPPLATEDFLKPGQRTLWCQTPQVVRSGLLQRLTPEEKKIQEAKFEILTSEASYLNSLRVLDNEFLRNHELTNEILTSSEKDKLFGGVPAVIKASERLLADLEIIWKEDPTLNNLPDILLKHSDKYLDIFVGYCSNQIKIDMTLKELRARKGGSKFVEAVAQIESRPECQSLPLNSFLMLPMQRITRLPLLADAVLSKLSVENTADRSSWEKVLSTFTYVASECNEGARAAAQEAEMEMITRKLEYSAKIKTLALKNRRLIKKGPVIRLTTKADMEYKLTFGKKFNKTPLYLFLLTDYLLVTKIKHNSTHDEAYIVTDVCKRNLLALETVSEDSPFAGRNAMMLTLLENYSGKQAEYVLTCESNTERERWLEAISPPKRETFGETLYEAWDCPQVMALYSYSPSQPDELTLQPGDVINVMRKMTDGWYHGEKLLNGEQGWFPANYTKEVASEHVRARNLKQRHRLLALTGSVLQRRAKQNLADRLQSVS
ncbi:uncharacterized protein LOC124430003 isoform X1 [Vespa crabro]|uniref:uncharacterized protein LOC124430003 isoform X1 n=1 Tax=Vespa crabro TaxID=7445 RepID=UPI001F027F40|nr:uncharacterized protein LOC124430003 isoform X1 [Vespa crabro]XP_046831933.1 uncharacterized protein LOC124430003 isoform X1 [Vespa crabro]XP_046831934.1 uncharacterized protein LOC124430003 isoform X1 [Vespa crabro]